MTRIQVVELEHENMDETIQETNINTLNESPSVFTIDNFITEEECQHMINISKPKMKDSLVSNSTMGAVSTGRTSKNAWIQHKHDEITHLDKMGTEMLEKVGLANRKGWYRSKLQILKQLYCCCKGQTSTQLC